MTEETVSQLLQTKPDITGDYQRDSESFGRFWGKVAAFLERVPLRRGDWTEASEAGHAARERFLSLYADQIYRAATNDLRSFVRVEQLVLDAAGIVPGLLPTPEALAAENAREQKDKLGLEIAHGIFLAHVLANPATGMHLCHAMLRVTEAGRDWAALYYATGKLELPTATVERRGRAAIVTLLNPRFLNAEDGTTLSDAETAIDCAILDPYAGVAVLRGGTVEHPKYAGRRIFSAGINLTHLYRGKIPLVWYMQRDMGLVNKIFRGVARGDTDPDELYGGTHEMPWIATIDGFAIGGGCQLLLAMDYVLAASDAYMTLPARKEGIIPGAANLRLPRFVGDRLARQAILSDRRFDCDTPEGRLICDEIAPPDSMDAALDRVIANLTSSGVVSAGGNRRALRVAQEPLDLFRRYMAVYAREQAYCHFSPALIGNLERYWNAAQRRL